MSLKAVTTPGVPIELQFASPTRNFAGTVLPALLTLLPSGLMGCRIAVRRGADGFLEKSCSRADFVAAIDRVAAGESHLCARSLNALAKALRRTTGDELRNRNKLTTREKEILLLVAEGNSSKEIAKKLFVGVSTVETHRANLMTKGGARSVAQLIQYAFENGLVATGRNGKRV